MALNSEGQAFSNIVTHPRLKQAGLPRPGPMTSAEIAAKARPPQQQKPQQPNITPVQQPMVNAQLPGGASAPPPGIELYNGGMVNTSMAPNFPGGAGGPIPNQPPPGFGQPRPVPQGTESQLYNQWQQTQQGMFNPSSGGVNGGGYSNPLDPKIQQTLSGWLDNPSRYDMPLVQNTFDMLNRQLSEGYNTQAQQVDEEMARRGLYNSTTAGGRLGDLRTNQARAQADMAQNLLMDQARTYSQDLGAATGAGMDFGRYGQNEDQRKFTNQMQTYGVNAGENQRAWNNYSGYGQQAFNNQMATADYNQRQDAINNQLLMQLLGGL